jgi:hypothetical protein
MTGHAEARLPVGAVVRERDATLAHRLPRSGNAALVSSALVQAVLGIEFTLAGLDKFADPAFLANFDSFVRANPGATSGPLAGFVQTLVLPNAALFATLLRFAEVALGPTLLIGAVEIGRRRLPGRLGARHGYEVALAMVAALAAVAAAGLTFSIFVLNGGVLPVVMPDRAFTTAIPVELLIVPFGLAVAWTEFGRFRALRGRAEPTAARPRG